MFPGIQTERLHVSEIGLVQVGACFAKVLELFGRYGDVGELINLTSQPSHGGAAEFHGGRAIREGVFDFDVGEVLEDAALHSELVEVPGDRELMQG